MDCERAARCYFELQLMAFFRLSRYAGEALASRSSMSSFIYKPLGRRNQIPALIYRYALRFAFQRVNSYDSTSPFSETILTLMLPRKWYGRGDVRVNDARGRIGFKKLTINPMKIIKRTRWSTVKTKTLTICTVTK